MNTSLPKPCAEWAERLAAVSPTDLAPDERAALEAHVAACPACAAVRADYRRMDARILGLPNPKALPGLPPALLQLWAEEDRSAGNRRAVLASRLAENVMRIKEETGAAMPAPTPIPPRHRGLRLISGISVAAAVVLIAVLAAALFASHIGKSATAGGQGNTATTTPAASRGWHAVPQLTHLAVQPILAPSNPKVVYEIDVQQRIFRRSDDSGAHWTNLSWPVQAAPVENAFLMVNAGNAQNVFLLLSIASTSPLCSGGQASTGPITAYSGDSGCQLSYYSANGGAQWGPMGWSAQAGESGKMAPVGEIVAQGDHLYSLFFDQNQHQRLITSMDAGATWQFADGELRAEGQGMCSFTAAPTGSALFALAQVGACAQPVGYASGAASHPQAQSGVALWRSDDAGAHWTLVSAFPYQSPDTQALKAVSSGSGQPTLFAAAGIANTYTRLVSTDGGKTWQPLVTTGFPADATDNFISAGTLSDGSVLWAVQTAQEAWAFYAWLPGSQTWSEVTTPLAGDPIDLIVVSSAGGRATIWVVTSHQGSFSVLAYTLK